jgi:hypothetical protein
MSHVLTKTKFADLLGVNKNTVTRWGKVGRLVLAHNGKVLVDETLTLLDASNGHRSDLTDKHALARGNHIQDATSATNNTHSATNGIEQSEDIDIEMQASSADIGEDRAYYKAITLDRGNQQLKLDEALKTGHRLNANDFETSLQQLGNQVRSGVERLIDNLAPQIASEKNEALRQEKIQEAIDSLQDQLS